MKVSALISQPRQGDFPPIKLRNHLQNIKNYELAMKLKKDGYGRKRASKIMDINIHLIDGWYRRNNRPIFYERKEELKNILKGV